MRGLPPLAARRIAVLAATSAMAALVVGGGACEFAVGDSIPAFACDPGPDTCPNNQVCEPTRHQCIPRCVQGGCSPPLQCDTGTSLCSIVDASAVTTADAVADAPARTDAAREATSPVSDATTERAVEYDATQAEEETTVEGGAGGDDVVDAGPCSGPMCKCSGPASCNTRICADELTVGQPLWAMAGSANFCTKPCCTSGDCDPTSVCFATAAGGNYCALAAWLGRSTALGAQPGGQVCTNDSDCRSGLCDSTSGTCADTCCSTNGSGTECGGASSCVFGSFPGASSFDQNYVAYCGQGGTRQNGSTCAQPDDCRSELCDRATAGTCRNACRNTADCSDQSLACMYVSPPNSSTTIIVAACFPPPRSGMNAEGSDCQSDDDCQSAFCDPSVMKCTDVCFDDSDCTFPGWRCRPEYVMIQSGGSASVLCCGT